MNTTKLSQVNVEAGRSASLSIINSLTNRTGLSLLVTAAFSLFLISASQRQSKAQAIEPEYIPLNAVQLDQLVAPIALDPDPLVAQILIGSTFPDQVTDANNWVSTKLTLTQDQRAASASNMAWDPSIKGLVVFPIVLDSMAKNNAWTVQLGNAYYNQPDDVMNAIQAMRLLAYKANFLVATVHENVEVSEEEIEILPVDTNAVYVQQYDPWQVWADVVTTFPGYVEAPAPAGVVTADGVSFDPPVSAGVDAHFGFSFGGWDPGWSSGAVAYNHNVYNSNSRTVANCGHFGGHDGRVFEHGGRGVPAGLHHDGRMGPGRSTPVARSMPGRVSPPRATPISHTGSVSRSTLPNRSASSNHNNVSNHFGASKRTAANNFSNSRNLSNPRSNSFRHTASPARSTMPNRAPAASRSINQANSMNANRSMNRPAAASNSFASNRATSRPAASTSSFSGNRPMSRPAAATRSFGGTQAMNRTASTGRSAGSFGGGHMGGGKR